MKQLKTVTVKVQRGYITRMRSNETEWEETLVQLPTGYYCIDGDAMPYYQLKDNGEYREFYDFLVPPDKKVFALADEYDEKYEDWESKNGKKS